MSERTNRPSAATPAAVFTLTVALAPLTAGQTVDWSAPTRAVSVALDQSDNVCTIDYEVQPGAEVTVTKRSRSGALLWTASIDQTDSTKWERAEWIAVDPAGDIVVAATLMSGFSSPVVAASLLLKFSASGAPLWRQVVGGPFDGTSTRKCLIDAAGDIYVLGTGVGTTQVTTKVKKVAADGTERWTFLDAANIGLPTNFKFSADGHLVVAARAPFGSVNGYTKVDALTGQAHWSLAGVQSLTVGDAAGDSLGHTYIVHGEYVTNGGTVVRKLDGQGSTLWSRAFASSGFRVELDPTEHAVVSGFPSAGAAGAAFFEVDPSGALVWANLDADGPQNLLLHAQMVVDERGSAYLAAGTLFAMAVCKVDDAGNSVFTATLPPGSGAHALALGRSSQCVVVVGGATARLLDPDVLGSAYCGPAIPNSTGVGATLSARGSSRVAWNDVTLEARSLPLNATAFFLASQSQGSVVGPGGSQGRLCLGGAIGRFVGPGQVQSSGSQGSALLRLELSQLPTPTGPTAAVAGATWNFQCWYRDLNPSATSNLSAALALTFDA